MSGGGEDQGKCGQIMCKCLECEVESPGIDGCDGMGWGFQKADADASIVS